MSFLTGGTSQVPNLDPQTQQLQQQLVKFLGGQGFGNILNPQIGPSQIDPFIQQFFETANTRSLAQAKESAGNLTGSGFANALGARAGESASRQGLTSAQFALQEMLARRQSLLQSLGLAFGGGQQQTVHKQGLLGAAAQGLGAAAPFLTGGPSTAAGLLPSQINTGFTPFVVPGQGVSPIGINRDPLAFRGGL